jgi:hypothetical protein
MAGFTKTNGTYGPIGSVINPFGPGVTVFSGDLGADPSAQIGPGQAVEKVIEYFTQLGTVAMYQINATGAYKVVLYPAGYPVTAAAAQTAIRAFGTVNGYDLSGATVTSGDLIA